MAPCSNIDRKTNFDKICYTHKIFIINTTRELMNTTGIFVLKFDFQVQRAQVHGLLGYTPRSDVLIRNSYDPFAFA